MNKTQEDHMYDIQEYLYRFVPDHGSKVFHRMAVQKLFDLLDAEYSSGVDGSYKASEMRAELQSRGEMD